MPRQKKRNSHTIQQPAKRGNANRIKAMMDNQFRNPFPKECSKRLTSNLLYVLNNLFRKRHRKHLTFLYTHVFAFLFILCHMLLLFIIIIFGSFAHLLVVCLSVYLFVLFACLVVALLVCLCVCGNTVRDS